MNDIRLDRIMNSNMNFDLFRSEVCHMLKDYGDYRFIECIVTNDVINHLWANKNYFQALYILAILDFLTDKYGVSYLSDYDTYRSVKFAEYVFPQDFEIFEKLGYENAKANAIDECSRDPIGKYFFRHNIIERDIYDVV